ncbi:MAG: replication protein C, IncQ-type [Methylococcaceae bacterium]
MDNVIVKYPAARAQRVVHAAPQFRPIKRGARRKGIERIYECNDGSTLTIALFNELDIADQDLLLCLLAIARATNRGLLVSPQPLTEKGKELRLALQLDGDATTQDALMIHATAYELLTELDKSTGKMNYEWLKKSLIRLSRVSFVYTNKKGFWTFNLLSVAGLFSPDGELDKLSICINPLSAQAVLCNDDGYVLLHRGERQELKSEESRALHSVLCGLVDMGEERNLNADMLADKVYSRYDEEVTTDAIRYRRTKIIAACIEIDKLGYWSCKVVGRGQNSHLLVKRKRRKDMEKVSI